MKFQDFTSFKKKFEEHIPLLTLIISKEEITKKILSICPKETQVFHCDSFKKNDFLAEVETIPFFGNKRFVYLVGIDELSSSDLEPVIAYINKPNAWVHLILSSKGATKLAKAVEKQGFLLELNEKPWEREKHLAEWLINFCKKEGVTLSLPLAKKLAVLKEEILANEIQKLLCFIGERKEITLKDIEAITQIKSQETLWNLGEAIFKLDLPSSLRIGKDLLDETHLIPLLAHLKTQMRTSLDMFSHYEKGGEQELMKAFPYLKGNLLEKKVGALTHYGKNRLKKAFLILMEGEIKAKDQPTQPEILLETILYRLCHSTSSPIF